MILQKFDIREHLEETELFPEHLQELLASSPPSLSLELKIPFLKGNWHTERGSELFETLYPKVTATQSGTGVRGGKVRASLDDCMDSVALVCHGRVKATAGPLTKRGKYLNASGYYDNAGRYKSIACRPTFLIPTLPIWEQISTRYGVPIPENPILFGPYGLAIGFWEWVRDNNIPVQYAEGEKKAGCLMLLGYAAISLNGIWMGRRVIYRESDGKRTGEQLQEDLQEFDTPGREITFVFDYRAGDFFQTVEYRAATATAKLLKNAIAKIAELPGPEKGVDDFCAAGGDVDGVILASAKIDELQKRYFSWLNKKEREKAWALSHPIAWDCNQRYLDIPYPSSGLTCIRSPKNTGKTYGLQKVVAKAQAENRKVLVVTHRIVLGRAICAVVGIPWIEEMKEGDRKIEGNHLGYGLCIDSLHPTSQASFNPSAWEGALIIFDEAEQIFWHAKNSATCREHRQAILASLRVLLRTVINSGGQVVLQDADLSDLSINFVREFSGIDVEPWLAVNHYLPDKPWTVTFYDTYSSSKDDKKDDPSGLLKDAVDCVNGGGKIWISCDSQKAKTPWGSKNLEKHFQSSCPGKRILRIDSETVANPEAPAYQCAEAINSLVANYDIIICTPTLATGVSVDLRGHFTAVYGIFQGAISDNEVRQSLARVREEVPRSVWCRQIAVGKVGNGSANYRELQNSKEKDVRYNIALLKDFDFDIDAATDPVALRYWAKYGARVNTGIFDFRVSVREGLQSEGHIIRSCSDDDSVTGWQIKELRIISQVEEAIEVSQAKDIDHKEFAKLEQQRSKTDSERYQEEKFRLKEIYKTEVTPELRQLDQDRWHGRIQRHYLLTHHPDFLWMRDRKHLEVHARNSEKGGGKVCLQDIRALSANIAVLETLNVLQFTEGEREWTNESPEVIEFAEKALRFAADIKICTGITISPKKVASNPIGIIQSFLGHLGLTLKAGKQQRKGGRRERPYSFYGFGPANIYDSNLGSTQDRKKIPEPEGLRDKIFEAWVQRDELALFEYRQKDAAIVEVDVTLQRKSAQDKVCSILAQDTEPAESVTPRTIDIVKVSGVTDSTIQTLKPKSESIANLTGWVQRWGKWCQAVVTGWNHNLTQYIVQSVNDEFSEMMCYPDKLLWECP